MAEIGSNFLKQMYLSTAVSSQEIVHKGSWWKNKYSNYVHTHTHEVSAVGLEASPESGEQLQ